MDQKTNKSALIPCCSDWLRRHAQLSERASACCGTCRSVVKFAEAFRAKELPLHVLVNNAGIFIVPHDHTEEGFEHIVGINYWGHFLLTHLLMDQLKSTPQSRCLYSCPHSQHSMPSRIDRMTCWL